MKFMDQFNLATSSDRLEHVYPVIVILTFQWPAPMRCLKFLADEWEALFVSEEDALVSRCLCGRAPMETERDRNLVGRSEGQILISSGDLFCSCGENAIKLGPTTWRLFA